MKKDRNVIKIEKFSSLTRQNQINKGKNSIKIKIDR